MSAGIDWTTVSVALITALSAAGGPYWIWHRQAARERASVRAALLAEVLALVELVELRGYAQGLREAEEYVRSSPDSEVGETRSLEFSVNINDHYNRVYQANVTRLGGLSPHEANQIVRFYQMTDSVKSDVTAGGVLAKGSDNPVAFREAADLLDAAMMIGRELTATPRRSKWRWRKATR